MQQAMALSTVEGYSGYGDEQGEKVNSITYFQWQTAKITTYGRVMVRIRIIPLNLLVFKLFKQRLPLYFVLQIT